MESISRAFYTKILNITQKKAVIKLVGKKNHDKRYIKKWRPISLLNIDTKNLFEAI